MLRRRDDQQNLFSADNQFLQFVGQDSFYGFLARHGWQLFRDQDFAALYCPDNGRNSVPPSLLCIALLLQAHDRVSDAEATRRRGLWSRQNTSATSTVSGWRWSTGLVG